MKAGRKPGSPTEKRARGTYKPSRHAGLLETPAPDDLPQAPHWLTASGEEAWLDLVHAVTRTHRACDLDSVLLGTLANVVGACAIAWKEGTAPPASYLTELRRLCELFGLAGVPSRVLAGNVRPDGRPNPFAKLGAQNHPALRKP